MENKIRLYSWVKHDVNVAEAKLLSEILLWLRREWWKSEGCSEGAFRGNSEGDIQRWVFVGKRSKWVNSDGRILATHETNSSNRTSDLAIYIFPFPVTYRRSSLLFQCNRHSKQQTTEFQAKDDIRAQSRYEEGIAWETLKKIKELSRKVRDLEQVRDF
jgi:hypothetical protein